MIYGMPVSGQGKTNTMCLLNTHVPHRTQQISLGRPVFTIPFRNTMFKETLIRGLTFHTHIKGKHGTQYYYTSKWKPKWQTLYNWWEFTQEKIVLRITLIFWVQTSLLFIVFSYLDDSTVKWNLTEVFFLVFWSLSTLFLPKTLDLWIYFPTLCRGSWQPMAKCLLCWI